MSEAKAMFTEKGSTGPSGREWLGSSGGGRLVESVVAWVVAWVSVWVVKHMVV